MRTVIRLVIPVGAFLVLSLFTGTATAQPVSDSTTTDQQRLLVELLDSDFSALADRSRRGRRIGGFVMLGTGAASVVGGGMTLILGETKDADIVGVSLMGGGALLAGLSLIPFRVRGESERIRAEFDGMPTDRPVEIHSKYLFGERRLSELARKRRTGRIVGGVSAFVVAGISLIATRNEPAEVRVNAFVWPALGGTTSLLVRSDEERRYDSYLLKKEEILRNGAQ